MACLQLLRAIKYVLVQISSVPFHSFLWWPTRYQPGVWKPVSVLGKVAVSKIVDYLRHTTSRGSEDSGLEELCNMLDPDQKDVSVDLETYHAIMREWIEDCKRKW